MTIRRLLVANRGEIARRVFRTCRDLGIETVAVHSDADAGAAYVAEADLAVHLAGSTPAETYLRGDLVVAAALKAGADAVHPGYGFLSESAAFARAVIGAGLTWVGPTPEAMDAMATKVEAKKLMDAAGVPVLRELTPEAATEADLPVLVKASAGGGGRGMRVARRLDTLGETVSAAAREAEAAFGDPTVFCEPYVERGRHVEVQILGEASGDRTHVLGARDCSVQRRHQKVVEEAPPVGIPDAVLAAMLDAARAAGEAIGYVGAGTVEFLYDAAAERFFFLEMNTRLQVEHPVTELVTGLDLVALQIAVAEGRAVEALLSGAETGHAIEARLYAEDPALDYQPQSGTLTRFEVDADASFGPLARPGVRVDSGVRSGDDVGTHYDAMLAKVVAWAPTRDEAVRRLAAVLRRARIHGLRTNRDLLVEVLSHPVFLAGEATTAFLAEDSLATLTRLGPPGDATEQGLAFFAAAVARVEQRAADRGVLPGIRPGWRNVDSGPQVAAFTWRDTEVEVGWRATRDGYAFHDVNGDVGEARTRGVVRTGADSWRVEVEHDGVVRAFQVTVAEDHVDTDSAAGHLGLAVVPRFADPADRVAEGSLIAPMPGTVVAVHAEPGAEIDAGRPVLVMEAMKMQHTIGAPHDGVVDEVLVAVGDQVASGAVLAVVRPHEPAPSTGQAPTKETA